MRGAGLDVLKVKNNAPGRYGDGDGLYLLVRNEESAFWLFRYTRAGKMREMGRCLALWVCDTMTLLTQRIAAALRDIAHDTKASSANKCVGTPTKMPLQTKA